VRAECGCTLPRSKSGPETASQPTIENLQAMTHQGEGAGPLANEAGIARREDRP